MLNDVRHRLNIRGTAYQRGATITSEEIGNTRLEGTLKRINWIKPRKESQAPAIPDTDTPAPESLPPKNRGGRPRTRPA